MPHHGTEFRFAGNARRVCLIRRLFGRRSVFLKGQAGSVHHHRTKARLDRAVDNRQVVDGLVVLVHHRDMVKMQHRVLRIRVFPVFPGNRFKAL